MAAYHRVYDSHHQQADCQELGSVWAIFTFLIPPPRTFSPSGVLDTESLREEVNCRRLWE